MTSTSRIRRRKLALNFPPRVIFQRSIQFHNDTRSKGRAVGKLIPTNRRSCSASRDQRNRCHVTQEINHLSRGTDQSSSGTRGGTADVCLHFQLCSDWLGAGHVTRLTAPDWTICPPTLGSELRSRQQFYPALQSDPQEVRGQPQRSVTGLFPRPQHTCSFSERSATSHISCILTNIFSRKSCRNYMFMLVVDSTHHLDQPLVLPPNEGFN